MKKRRHCALSCNWFGELKVHSPRRIADLQHSPISWHQMGALTLRFPCIGSPADIVRWTRDAQTRTRSCPFYQPAGQNILVLFLQYSWRTLRTCLHACWMSKSKSWLKRRICTFWCKKRGPMKQFFFPVFRRGHALSLLEFLFYNNFLFRVVFVLE